MTSWSLRARARDLSLGEIYQDWYGTMVNRTNWPDTLQVTGRVENLRSLFTNDEGDLDPSGGVTLDDDRGTCFSGNISQIVRQGNRTCTVTFKSDLWRVWTPLCFPTPSRAITDQTVDYGDVRSGPAETVALGFIEANAGPSAYHDATEDRRVAGLVVPLGSGRGLQADITSRLDVLGPLVSSILEPSALRFNVLQQEDGLVVVVDDMIDMTDEARYGDASAGGPGWLADDWKWTIDEPTVNVAIVAGGGEGTARSFLEQVDPDSLALWGRRIEQLVDQRQTTDPAELSQAAVDAITSGASPVSIEAPILDSPDLRLGHDVPLGAKVTIDLDGYVMQHRVRQLTTTMAVTQGAKTISVSGVVGSPDAGLTADQKAFIEQRKIKKGQMQ